MQGGGIASGTVSEILNVNVRGPKRVDDAFVPLLDPKAGRVVQMSSGAASGCVSRCTEARQKFFIDTQVTWAQISALLTEVEALPGGAKDLEGAGLGASMGVYGLSKACLMSWRIAIST